MRRFTIISIVSAGLFFIWGGATVRYQLFPWSIIQPMDLEIQAFIAGDTSEKTGIVDKLSNDFSLRPARQLFDYQRGQSKSYIDVALEPIKRRRDLPKLYISDQNNNQPLPGYRFIFGTFDFETHLHGGILLDDVNQVIQTWIVDEESIKRLIDAQVADKDGKRPKYEPAARRLPQGVAVFPDGSIVFNDGDRGNGMHKMDKCGKYQWNSVGNYHHSITYNTDDHSIWTFGSEDMMQLNPDTGTVIRHISLEDLIRENQDISIFSARRDIRNAVWHYDPIHKNDIEALPEAYARQFPDFEAGDLLVSHRSTNLLFVFDPDTLKIKWWRSGQTRRQHDPDWQPDGTITVFDNNLRENYAENWDGYLPDGDVTRFSRVLKINPKIYHAEVLYDGAVGDMYSGERSKHQVLPNGNVLMTSAHQGRVLEVTSADDITFEFLNIYDDQQSLILSEAIWLPLDFFPENTFDQSACLD